MTSPWQTARRVLTGLFVSVGLALTAYIAVATFGLVKSSSEHYATFVLGIVLLAGLLALRGLADARLEERALPLFRARLGFAMAATAAAVTGAAFIRLHAVRLEQIQPFYEPADLWFAAVFTVGVLGLSLLHWGWLLTGIVAAAIAYFFYGHLIDNVLFTHAQYETNFVMNYVALGTGQGFQWLAQLAADSIYFLIIYAAILLGVGMLNMVLEVGKLTGRRIHGGSAFPALIGSGVVGSVMGQAVSNVVLTGRLTIPMMIRYRYGPAMAGAIEATASTSGQILPPILGLAGFIIASFLNRPYIDIALAALIPGLLYLSGVTMGVMAYARRNRLPKLTERADLRMTLRLLPTFAASFGIVIVLLLGYYSPALAGLAGILVALGFCLLQGPYRPSRKALAEAVEEGLVLVTLLSLLLIAIGPLGQAMLTTNLSGRLGSILIAYLPDTPLLLLAGAMVVSLILGMGLPTPVAYIIVALAVVPFMQGLGIAPLQAHFFVFYFAVFSTLTPPIAISVLAAAKLAGAPFLRTALHAMKLALTTFILPFGFVYNPSLLAFPDVGWSLLPPLASVLALQLTVAVACYGWFLRDLGAAERAAFAVVSAVGFAGLVTHGLTVNAVFGALALPLIAWIWATRGRGFEEPAAQASGSITNKS